MKKFANSRVYGPYPSIKWSFKVFNYIDSTSNEDLVNSKGVYYKFSKAMDILQRAGIDAKEYRPAWRTK